jgi:RND superfamily putative drug exporter
VGDAVTGRPAVVGAAAVVALAVLASGGAGLSVGQTPNEEFLKKPEAVLGQEQLARAFPAGSGQPALVVAPAATGASVEQKVKAVAEVSDVRRTAGDERYVAYDVVLSTEPGSAASRDRVEALRVAVQGTGAKVGGGDAELLDSRNTADRDRTVLFPVILGIVLLVLLLLLRSVVAAVLLVATVVATYVVSMGASWFAFDHLLGFPPLADSTPLLAFLFLVALGVDYNIFLTTRAREEASEGAPAREAIVRALAVTGGVITSAGILLAAVFAVLGVLPLVQLAQGADRRHRRLRCPARHAGGAQHPRAGPGQPARRALLVAQPPHATATSSRLSTARPPQYAGAAGEPFTPANVRRAGPGRRRSSRASPPCGSCR